MSWLSENVFDPIENVGNALIHGDIMGGQYQASGSDWLKTAGVAGAALGAGALGAGALGAFGAAEGAGALGAGELGAEGGSLFGAGATAPELTGAFGNVAAADPWTTALADPEVYGAMAQGGGEIGRVTTSGMPIEAFGAETQLPADELSAFAGGGGGPPTTGDGGIFDTVSNFAGEAKNYAMKHPFQTLGVGAAAAGLGSALMKGQGTSANEQNVANMTSAAVQQAQYDTAAGRELQAYLRNGTLPAGMQAQVDKARKAARAAAISAAAKSGQNTNPQNNTQLQQAFEEADRQALIMATQLETQLFQQGTTMIQAGLQATQLSQQGYEFLVGVDQKKDAQVTNAMIALAGAFGGGKTNINLGRA